MDAREPILDQRIEVAIGARIDAPAAAAVAAARSTARDVLLTAESGNAVPAFSGVHFNGGFVDELHFSNVRLRLRSIN
jgi:hypothetical protein